MPDITETKDGKYLIICPRDIGKTSQHNQPVHYLKYQGISVEEAVKAWNGEL